MGKKEIKKSVSFDEDEFAQITQAMISLDSGFSEVVRGAMQIGLPLLLDRPSLIKILDGIPQNSNRELSR